MVDDAHAPPRYAAADAAPRARNVILISGDGMGPAQVEAGRLLLAGAAGLEVDRLEVRGRVTTGPPNDRNETVTDSAAAATAWSTGSRTSNGAVGMDAAGRPLPTFGREAKAAGKGTGLVTTTAVTDASPAAFFAGVTDRGYADQIASQYLDDGGPDVILGGGRIVWASDGLLGRAQAAGYGFADSAQKLGTAGDTKLLGLFADENLWEPSSAGPPPSLAALTTAALSRLSAAGTGFFLFVEEEGIDEASHANDGPAMLAAMRRLDEAVGAARRFVEANPETLLIVTGDHETGGLSVDRSPNAAGPGQFPVAGSDQRFSLRWRTGGHTDTPTPAFATGPSSEQLMGDWPNTRLHEVLTAALLRP